MISLRHTLALVVPAALLLGVCVAFAGCSSTSPDADATTGGADDEGPITSRLDAYNAGLIERDVNLYAQYQDATARCMKEKGFEYVLVPYKPDNSPIAAWGVVEDRDLVANAKEVGYRAIPATKAELMRILNGVENQDFGDWWFDEGNPNATYFNSLPAHQQPTYIEALLGVPVEVWLRDPELGNAGCEAEAYEVYNSLPGPWGDPVVQDFWDYMDDKMVNDPRVVKVEKDWSSCMAGKGYTFSNSEEAAQSFVDRLNAMIGDYSPDEGMLWVLDQITDADVKALHADEIATATADAECAVEFAVETYGTVWFEFEAEYYNAHKVEVDAWLAELEW
ncbi:MAG: hypothetical protein FWF02_01370 [Micrococcales bacterium]|nr:hypothetical protein [Micrococcales bacterium]MCL2666344.1 hypothetical protein [Micrococcales bacterium]